MAAETATTKMAAEKAAVSLMMVAVTTGTIVTALAMIGRGEGGAGRGGVAVDVVVAVALLVHLPSLENPATNPTVGIGAPGIFFGSACVPFRLRPHGRYPPILLSLEDGPIEGRGTPRITMTSTGLVRLVILVMWLMLLSMMTTTAPVSRQVVVSQVSASTSSTHGGSH